MVGARIGLLHGELAPIGRVEQLSGFTTSSTNLRLEEPEVHLDGSNRESGRRRHQGLSGIICHSNSDGKTLFEGAEKAAFLSLSHECVCV